MHGGTSELVSLNCNLRNERPAFGPASKHSLLTAYYRQQEKRPLSQGTSNFQKLLDLRKFHLAYTIYTWLNHLHCIMPAYFPTRYPLLWMSLTLICQRWGIVAYYKYPSLPHSPPPVEIRQGKQIRLTFFFFKSFPHLWGLGTSFSHSVIHFHFCPLSSSCF